MVHRYSGELLRELCTRSHLTQRHVESSTGISKSTVHYGLQEPLTLERLLTLYSHRMQDIEHHEKMLRGIDQEPQPTRFQNCPVRAARPGP